MKTRWIASFATVAVFTLTTGSFGQTATTPEQTYRPSLSGVIATVAPSEAIAALSEQIPPPPPQPPQTPQKTKVVQLPRTAGTTTAPEQQKVHRPKSSFINVRLEFTITDQTGTKLPAKKTVMMLVADGEGGRIRTANDISIQGKTGSYRLSLPLNIDASPEVDGSRIRLRVSLELDSQSDPGTGEVPVGSSKVQQSVTSIVTDGVATILSQSADPVNDRKVTLEVKATILK